MKEGELRINNFYEYANPISEDKYFQWGWNHFQSEKNNLNLYKPIPITKEWLVKFGFELLDTHIEKFPITLNTIKDGYDFSYFPSRHDEKGSVMIKYVHQLQNIYYDLTGDELIK